MSIWAFGWIHTIRFRWTRTFSPQKNVEIVWNCWDFHGFIMYDCILHSLKLTANAPETRPSQKEIHLPTIQFQAMLVWGHCLEPPGGHSNFGREEMSGAEQKRKMSSTMSSHPPQKTLRNHHFISAKLILVHQSTQPIKNTIKTIITSWFQQENPSLDDEPGNFNESVSKPNKPGTHLSSPKESFGTAIFR